MAETLFESLVKDTIGMTHSIRVDSEEDGGLTFFMDGRLETHFSGADMGKLMAGETVVVNGHPFSMPPEVRESWQKLQAMRELLDTIDALLGDVQAARAQLRREQELSVLLHHPVAKA